MKKRLLALSLTCIMLTGCGVSAKQKEQELIEQTYALNLNSATTQMLSGAALSETICNKTAKVWYDAIYDVVEVDTIKYMRDKDTYEEVDFNGALKNLYEDEAIVSSVETIKENRQTVDDLMSELATPPEKYAICYDTITDLYKIYTKFTSLAITPTGSYKEYTENFAEIDDDFMTTYNLIQTQLPDVEVDMAS
ncbi:MAG: hypothetical protein K2O14_08010 [Oscillospiraceae bacterium]|nr:hypothetical protein [Oscillospiraceae bacterium]